MQRLAATHKPLFLVPLGLKAWFAALGIDRVHELDWWDSHRVGTVTLTLSRKGRTKNITVNGLGKIQMDR